MFFAQDTLGYDDNIQSLVTKGSEHIIQTSTEILNVCCDLDLEHSIPKFPLDTLAYEHDAPQPN